MTKYKTLMHGSAYINPALLSQGIYAGSPVLFSADTTVESYIVHLKDLSKDMPGASDLLSKIMDNIRQCEFVECDFNLSIDSPVPVVTDAFFDDVRAVVDYDWNAEEENYRNNVDTDGHGEHVFCKLQRIDSVLKKMGK